MRKYLFKLNRLTKRAKTAKRRSLKLGVKGYFTRKTIENLYCKQRGRCACCGFLLNGDFEIDHITPLSRGGSNYPSNLQLLKPLCNKLKGSKTMEEYMNEKREIG
jgi:5-methylcytosine-specific restriction endonuclease McrA